MKLLSPAGNLTSLKCAVFNGADEVYLGINQFNARNNIDGFTLDNLEQAVDFCHIYGVKVNLAINILFSNDELPVALNTVKKAYNFGVDYFIVQDLGLASLIHKHLPNAVLHASTQMAIHNLEGVRAIIPFGFKRVVLARETPLEEIKRIKNECDIEIEYFVHGALCVSFSGNCYLSSYLNDASGNRGRCKQLCRLPYAFQKDGMTLKEGYLLSAKDFDMREQLSALKDAGVDVLKIEGRARRPFYVATATKEYKKALEGLSTDSTALNLAFNRGFSAGYFNGNHDIISNVQNHVGVKIGKVIKVNNKKNYKEVLFTSNRPLSAKSSFKTFTGEKENAVLTAYDLKKLDGNKYVLTTTAGVKVGDEIRLIVDAKLEEQTLSIVKKVNIPLTLTLKKGEPMLCQFTVNNLDYSVLGDITQEAVKAPLGENEVINCFKKSEYFNCDLTVNMDKDLFVVKKQLNEFRRKVFSSIESALTKVYKRNADFNEDMVKKFICDLVSNPAVEPLSDFVVVEKISDIPPLTCKTVIYSPFTYEKEDILSAKSVCEKTGKKFALSLPNFALDKDVKALKNLCESLNLTVVVNNYYALNFKCDKIVGGYLNVYNEVTAHQLNAPYLTAELSGEGKINLPYMTLRHCPYKNHLGASCDKCPHQEGFELKMQSGKVLKIKRIKISSCTFYLTD